MANDFKDSVEKRVLAIGKPTTNSEPTVTKMILAHEKFSPTPYSDFKQTSIGYGTKAVGDEKSIDEATARARAVERINEDRGVILDYMKQKGYNWSPNQIDALTSFRYNIGSIGQLTANGTRSDSEIAKAMLLYDKAVKDGKAVALDGLTKRRKQESDLFLKGMRDKEGSTIVRGK